MTRAVIFDVDGTLVDSVDLHANAWLDAFREFGKEVEFARVRRDIGKGSDKLMPDFLSEEEIEEFGDELSEYRERRYQEEYMPRVVGFPKVRELLERLRARGQRVALATSGETDVLEANKKAADIEGLADVETSSSDVEESKPEPDVFAAALEKLGDVDPSEVVVVGDTPYDAEAAGKLGLRTVGLLCGGFPESELRRAGCVAIFRDPADLLARIDESPLGGE
jgi:HAD superfamily hydrolase (TIGR01509 family)